MQSKPCPNCNFEFTPSKPDRKYCSLRCRNAAKRKREKEREVVSVPTKKSEAELEAMMYFTPPIDNPTQEVITQLANLLVSTKSLKPVLFRGEAMPQVEMPERVRFGQTQLPTEWLMFYE